MASGRRTCGFIPQADRCCAGRGGPDDRDRPGAAHRVRQRRQHAAGARLRTAEGNRHPPRDRREPRPAGAAAAHREPRPRGARRVRRRHVRRARAQADRGAAAARFPCRSRSACKSTPACSCSRPPSRRPRACWRASRRRCARPASNLVSDLKGDAHVAKAGRRWTLRDGLVVLQTAVTLVLLVAAGLLTRSILRGAARRPRVPRQGVAALAPSSA